MKVNSAGEVMAANVIVSLITLKLVDAWFPAGSVMPAAKVTVPSAMLAKFKLMGNLQL